MFVELIVEVKYSHIYKEVNQVADALAMLLRTFLIFLRILFHLVR